MTQGSIFAKVPMMIATLCAQACGGPATVSQPSSMAPVVAGDVAATDPTVLVRASIGRDDEIVAVPVAQVRLGEAVEARMEFDGTPIVWTVSVEPGPQAGTYLVRAGYREGQRPELHPTWLIRAGESTRVTVEEDGHVWSFDLLLE